MPTLADLKGRIKSIKSTQHITRAMKMIAQARLRQWRELLTQSRPYASALETIVANLTQRVSSEAHPLLEQRDEKKQVFLIITSDRGLCGSFNSNVVKMVEEIMEKTQDAEVQLFLVGKKGLNYFRRQQYPIEYSRIGIFQDLNLSHATPIAAWVLKRFSKADINSFYIIYNQFKSLLEQKVVIKKLLPLLRAEPPRQRAVIDYIYEPQKIPVLKKLISLYIVNTIYLSFLESYTAEQAARMITMESATNNAEELLEQLTLLHNKLRQAHITKELLEIVSTSEALKEI
jgi:F-type H+-transporting ATPase subunit gamma